MPFWKLLYYAFMGLLTIIILLALGFSVYVTFSQERLAFSLSLPKAPFISYDLAELPTSNSPMCFDDNAGFCDDFSELPYLIYAVTDWHNQSLGGIWQVGERCYLQMFPANSNHPYIATWLESCPNLN